MFREVIVCFSVSFFVNIFFPSLLSYFDNHRALSVTNWFLFAVYKEHLF